MMVRDHGPFKLANPWPQIGWWAAISVLTVSVILGFLVLSRFQQNGPALDTWTARPEHTSAASSGVAERRHAQGRDSGGKPDAAHLPTTSLRN